MNLQQIRWPVVVGTLALTLALLFGGTSLMKTRTVDEPVKDLFAKSEAVSHYSVDRLADKYEVRVQLKENVDLATTYVKLNNETKKIFQTTPYKLVVEDDRTPELDDLFRRLNLYVQEAVSTGQFATMSDRIQQEATKAGVTARLSVDGERVYLELKSSKGYLYHVEERTVIKTARPEGGLNL